MAIVGVATASAELTSRNAPALAKVFAEHPDADNNKDRILNFEEYDQFQRSQGAKEHATPVSMELKNGDLFITDFEERNRGRMQQWGWKFEGQAFSQDLQNGTKMMKRRVGFFGGRYLLTSYANTDEATGVVRSPEFVVTRPFIKFLVSGGDFPRQASIELIVEGEAVRSASGRNDDLFESVAFDVTEFAGKTAHVQIVDSHRGLWGRVNVDRIVQSQESGGARVINGRPRPLPQPPSFALSRSNQRLRGDGEIRDGKLHVGGTALAQEDLLMAVRDPEPGAVTTESALRLKDGEVWMVRNITFDDGKLRIESAMFGAREIPLESVASLDFKAADSASIVSEPGNLYRTNGDPIPGKLVWARAKDIAIDCALGIVPVPREVVTRFVLAKPEPRESGDEIRLVDGSLLFGEITFEGDKLAVKHATLEKIAVPWNSVHYLRRSTPNVRWLDRAESTIVERRGPALPPPAPELIEPTDATHLRAIRMMPRTVVRYQIPAQHAKALRGQLVPVPGCRANLSVRVLAGDAEVWQQKVTADGTIIPVAIDLSKANTDALTLEVDFDGPLAFPCGVDWRDTHVIASNTSNPANPN